MKMSVPLETKFRDKYVEFKGKKFNLNFFVHKF